MDFWIYFGYVLSFLTEIFNISLFDVVIHTGEVVHVQFGYVILASIILTVLFHLLTPSARGI